MLDLKKLIASFLLISAVVGSSVALVSLREKPRGVRTATTEQETSDERWALADGGNVFIEPVPIVPQIETTNREPAINLLTVADKGNLTEYAASLLAKEIVSANPNGPGLENGIEQILVPEEVELKLGELIEKPKYELLRGEVDENRIRVQSAAKESDIIDYFTRASEILSATFSGKDFEAFSELTGPYQDKLRAGHFIYASAEAKLYDLQVPEPLADLHRAFLSSLVFQKFAFDTDGRSRDPLRSAMALTNYVPMIGADYTRIAKELNVVAEDLPRLLSTDGKKFLLENFFVQIFFVQESLAAPGGNTAAVTGKEISNTTLCEAKIRLAEAAGIIDPTSAASTVATNLLAVPTVETLTSPLVSGVNRAVVNTRNAAIAACATAASTRDKNIKDAFDEDKKLLTEIIKDRLVHLLVQQTINWVQGGGKPQFITDWKGFLTDAANEAAGDVIQEIAPGLCRSFGTLVELTLQPVPSLYNRPVFCTLDRVVDNVQDFYNDFRYGGWIAYGAALRPENNFFGSIIVNSDRILEETARREEAAKNEGLANKGFLSVKKCVSWDANGKCTKEEATTPGGAVAASLDHALGASFHRIVNAEDFVALVSAVVNSAINRLIRAGVEGLAGALNQSDSGDDLSGACDGMTGQALTNCQANVGAVGNAIQSAPASFLPTSTIADQISTSTPVLVPTGISTGTTPFSSSTLPDPCEGLTGFDLLTCNAQFGRDR
ncbi:hypothetical protein C4571_03040 [Candidatus Parcubacteria bacterium]|nr:MAG: hypothetical protein C4571_03040 [Candidatus Parcubacteria bacterium]